jgi:hypothetical protein
MRDSKLKSASNTPLATEVGEHLHMDLIPLTHKTIGNNTFLLFAVDEKSGFCAGVPIAKKQESHVVDATKVIISEFTSHGHRVQRITTDDEKSLQHP